MKAREAARLQKIADALVKIAAMVKASKTERALKSLMSLKEKTEKLTKGAAKKGAKRPATGFAKFMKENFKKVAKLHPNKKATEITKILAKMYNEKKGAKKSPAKKAAPKKEKKAAPKKEKKPAAKKTVKKSKK